MGGLHSILSLDNPLDALETATDILDFVAVSLGELTRQSALSNRSLAGLSTICSIVIAINEECLKHMNASA